MALAVSQVNDAFSDLYPLCITNNLNSSQGTACLGAILWSVIDCTHGWRLYLQFVVFAYGVYSTRINAALLAVCLFSLQLRPACYIQRFRRYFVAAGTALPAAIVLLLVLTVARETPPHGQKVDPNFQYGESQEIAAAVVLALSFAVSVVAMVLTQRFRHRASVSQANSPVRTNGNGSAAAHSQRQPPADEASRNLLDFGDDEEESVTALNSPPAAAAPTGNGANLEIEDMISSAAPMPTSSANGGENSLCQQTGCGSSVAGGSCEGTTSGRRSGLTRRGRYRCDSEHREYCSSLLDRYAVPPALEALDCRTTAGEGQDETQYFRHMVLLLLLVTSTFVGENATAVYIVLTEINSTLQNF